MRETGGYWEILGDSGGYWKILEDTGRYGGGILGGTGQDMGDHLGTVCPTLMGFTVSPLGSIGDLLPHICGVCHGFMGVTWRAAAPHLWGSLWAHGGLLGPSAPHLWGFLWAHGGLLGTFCPTLMGFAVG